MRRKNGKPFQIKQLTDTGFFSGYASVFGVVDYNRDVMIPGAFKASLAQGMPKLLWQHKQDQPIGIYTKAIEDSTGLYVEGQLNLDVQGGREAASLLAQKAVDGLSVGFYPVTETFDPSNLTSLLTEVDLQEVSIVTFPCNAQSRVEVVKSIDDLKKLSDVEDYLHDRGLSRQEVVTVVSRIKGLSQTQGDPVAKHADPLLAVLQKINNSPR